MSTRESKPASNVDRAAQRAELIAAVRAARQRRDIIGTELDLAEEAVLKLRKQYKDVSNELDKANRLLSEFNMKVGTE